MGDNENYEDVISEDNTGTGDAVQKLQEERDSLYDRLLRKQAEFDNFRKRAERERGEYIQFASAELVRELLNALDSFDAALHKAAPGSDENLLRGFELIYKQIQDTLGRSGLKPIEARGAIFDPQVHQAVTTVPTDSVTENTVVDELRKGYTLNGRLLRPAMVSVAVKGERGKGD
jgi:molecular chaperone GrpE